MGKIMLITVVVLVAFQDKYDHKTQYAPGAELQVEKDRADDLVTRGLAKLKVTPKAESKSGTTDAGGKPVKDKKDKDVQVKDANLSTAPLEEEKKEVKEEEDATAADQGTEK